MKKKKNHNTLAIIMDLKHMWFSCKKWKGLKNRVIGFNHVGVQRMKTKSN